MPFTPPPQAPTYVEFHFVDLTKTHVHEFLLGNEFSQQNPRCCSDSLKAPLNSRAFFAKSNCVICHALNGQFLDWSISDWNTYNVKHNDFPLREILLHLLYNGSSEAAHPSDTDRLNWAASVFMSMLSITHWAGSSLVWSCILCNVLEY